MTGCLLFHESDGLDEGIGTFNGDDGLAHASLHPCREAAFAIARDDGLMMPLFPMEYDVAVAYRLLPRTVGHIVLPLV